MNASELIEALEYVLEKDEDPEIYIVSQPRRPLESDVYEVVFDGDRIYLKGTSNENYYHESEDIEIWTG